MTPENGEDGLVSSPANAAVYYPHGLASNLDGTNVMVPSTHCFKNYCI